MIIAARATLSVWPIEAADPSQSAALSWSAVTAVLILGLPALEGISRLGIPSLIDREVSHRERVAIPLAGGLVGGLGLVLWDIAFVLPRDLNVPFPHSVPFYFVGAFFVEVVQHLLPMLIWLGLVHRVLLGGRWPGTTYWVGAALIAWVEPLGQLGGGFFEGYSRTFFVVAAAVTYAINLAQLALLRKSGFLAMLTYRLGLYFLWHIVWGTLRLTVLY